MRTLTDIELQYVSGGFTSTPAPSPNPSPNPSQPNKPWYEDITDTITNGMRRVSEAIAGIAEDIGAAVRAITDKGPETVDFTWTDGYKRTSCATGQELDGDKCTYPKGN
jgi:hypothetical protein